MLYHKKHSFIIWHFYVAAWRVRFEKPAFKQLVNQPLMLAFFSFYFNALRISFT